MDKVIEILLFTPSEIEVIKRKLHDTQFTRSTVTKSSREDIVSDYRKSFQAKVNLDGDLGDLILNKFSQMGIKSLPKSADILKYSTGDEFKRHTDNGYPHEYRYRTAIIQLTDISEYSGGELEIFNKYKITANKTLGNTILFDSSLEHSANKITRGTRYCMVIWFEKKHFGLSNTFI